MLTGVDVHDGEIVLREPGTELRLLLVPGRWTVTDQPVPVAASGGWTDPAHLSVDLLFLEAPHRLSVTADIIAGTVDARWTAPPLLPPSLRLLRAPR